MKPITILILVFALTMVGCDQGKTTDTLSSEFSTLAEKQEFLEGYMKFRRSYDELHYRLSYIDGGGGMMAGPTEWNVRLMAVVPEGEIDQWIDGLSVASDPELDWVTDIPGAPTDLGRFKWHEGDRVIVGIDRKNRIILYWNHTS